MAFFCDPLPGKTPRLGETAGVGVCVCGCRARKKKKKTTNGDLAPAGKRQRLVPPVPPRRWPGSEVALTVERCGEGLVVEGSGDGVGALVRSHAGNAVLRLVRGQLSPQLLGRDVVLGWIGGVKKKEMNIHRP